MITINTSRFGELEVSEDQLFTFPMGLLGFAASKSFVIIDLESQKPFKWLQCIDDPSTAFILGDPLYVDPTYCAVIRRTDLTPLGTFEDDHLVLSVILTITERPEDMTANLCAPLIFNLVNRRGMQYVLNDQKYPVRYRIFNQKPLSTQSDVVESPNEPRSLSLR